MLRTLGYIAGILAAFGAGIYCGRPAQTPVTVPQSANNVVDLSVIDGGIYRVRKVIDGDTVVLENGLHVRYNGMNAPETGHFVKDVAPMGKEATDRNIALVEDKRVRLRLGKEPLDIHGRVVAHVIILPSENPEFKEETDAGMVLVKEGLARSMGLGISKEEFEGVKKLEQEAKDAKRGLWGLEDHLRETTGKPYWASSNPTGLYHLSTCPIAQRIKAANRHEYATIDEAEAAGLKPCKCVPK